MIQALVVLLGARSSFSRVLAGCLCVLYVGLPNFLLFYDLV